MINASVELKQFIIIEKNDKDLKFSLKTKFKEKRNSAIVWFTLSV